MHGVADQEGGVDFGIIEANRSSEFFSTSSVVSINSTEIIATTTDSCSKSKWGLSTKSEFKQKFKARIKQVDEQPGLCMVGKSFLPRHR